MSFADPAPKNVRLLNELTGETLRLELADRGYRDGIRWYDVVTPAHLWMRKFDTMLVDEMPPHTAITFPTPEPP